MGNKVPALWFGAIDSKPLASDHRGRGKRRKKGAVYLGCEGCPLVGSTKVLQIQEIEGRIAMLWGASPGKTEVLELQNFVGSPYSFLWKEFARYGITPEWFDTQNIVRCRPVTRTEEGFTFDREPSKEEIIHCSEHTEAALEANAGKAAVHVVLGKLAGETLFGKEYRKDTPIFWSEKLQAKVFVLDHPSVFQRNNFSEWRLSEFKDRLAAAAWSIKHPGRYEWLNHLKVSKVSKPGAVRRVLSDLRKSKERVAIDIEEGNIDGQRRILCLGVSWKKNESVVIVLDHPENAATQAEREEVFDQISGFLQDKTIRKAFQYGPYDTDTIFRLWGVEVQGWDFDTTYAHYLRYTFLRSHSLDSIANAHYPMFCGYKDVVSKYYKLEGGLAECPLDTLVKYNGADAILTKRIELDLRDEVSLPLVQVYIGAGVTLYRMEKRGPVLDQLQFEEAMSVIPERVKTLAAEIRLMADDPDLNPNAPMDVAAVLYDKLKLPTIADLSDDYKADKESDIRNTRESTLQIIGQATGHRFPQAVLEYRRYSKMESTYLRGYGRSAEMNGGELRTRWYLTGAVTGRLRSGGTKEGVDGVVNLQNLHGSPYLQNLIVSDPSWRDVLKYGGGPIPEELLDLEAFLAFDYSQIEIRMLAEVSGDPLLIQQFNSGMDIHCMVGSTLNPEWTFDFVKQDKPTRTFVKNCHFGLVYGLSEGGLYYYLKAKGIDTTEEAAAEFHRSYFEKYKGVAAYIIRQREFAEEHGYVETIYGFRRWIGSEYEEDRTTNPMNQAVNSPIQGAAHTLVLSALAILARKPKTYLRLARPVMEIHDAIVFRVKLRDLALAAQEAKLLLEQETPRFIHHMFRKRLRVPILSEGSAGFRYGVMTEYEGSDLSKFLVDWNAKNAGIEKKMRDEFQVAA